MPILGSQSAGTKGPSTTPTIGTATAGNASASITFTAPSFSKLPITSYTVTASPGGATGTGASSPITVSGLSNGTGYTFTVTANNSNGVSEASSASNSATPVQPYAVGGTGPGGGIIFYDAGSNLSWGRYIEAATGATSPSWSDATYAWSGNTTGASGATLTGIGTGFTNTLTMLGFNATASRAGTICRAYTGGGYSSTSNGWFLPSTGELNALYNQKSTVGGFVNSNYWTSTETGNSIAARQNFTDGTQNNSGPKSTLYYVRPIRYFS
jgi:hypothetical protein